MKGAVVAVVAILAVLVIWILVRSWRGGASGGGPAQTIPDGTVVTAQSFSCPAGSIPVLRSASYGPADGSAPSVNVLPKLQALINRGQPFTVGAQTLGAKVTGVSGALSYTVSSCMDLSQMAAGATSSKSGFRQCPPFISCDRAYDLDYSVDATVRGGSAIVWSPYVAGSQYDGWPTGWTPDSGQGAGEASACGGQADKKKEGFEPIPCLPCNSGMIPPLGDAAEVDRPYTDAPVPQPLLYSTIANMPPARGVKQQLETEPETTVTHLSVNGRVGQMADPYLSDAARFGPSAYEIPPGDPGYMVPVTDFMESFSPKPAGIGVLRSLTRGRSGFAPKRSSLRFSGAWDDSGGMADTVAASGFGRAAISAKRSRRH